MRTKEKFSAPRGFVTPYFINLATGDRMKFGGRHNTLSYMSAEAMAAAFGGDDSYIPSRMGFIYGGTANPGLGVITRDQTWTGLEQELGGLSSVADIQVVHFSYPPSLVAGSSDSSSDPGSSSAYDNIKATGANAVVFHAHSNSTSGGEFGSDTVFSKDAYGTTGPYLYQAVLLAYHNSKYYVISRVDLAKNGVYLQKPRDYEVALDWTITFK